MRLCQAEQGLQAELQEQLKAGAPQVRCSLQGTAAATPYALLHS